MTPENRAMTAPCLDLRGRLVSAVANEAGGRIGGRRSVHASVDIAAGCRIDRDMLKVVRPAGGIPPAKAECLIGRVAMRPLNSDEPIDRQDIP